MSEKAILYSAQINRPAPTRWAKRIPREVGAAIITEAVHDLIHGDCGTIKALPFISRLNARRKHRTKPAGVAKQISKPRATKEKLLRIPITRDRLAALRRLAASSNTTVEALAARRLIAAPIR